MAKKKSKNKLSPSLIIIGIISSMFATFSLMCIPCLMAAYPSIGIFFALLGAVSLSLGRYSWAFLILGVLLLALGALLALSRRSKKCV